QEALAGEVEQLRTNEEKARTVLAGLVTEVAQVKDTLQSGELAPIQALARHADVILSNVHGMAREAWVAFTDEALTEPEEELFRVPRLRASALVVLKEVDRAQEMFGKLGRLLGARISERYELSDLQDDATTACATLSLARQLLQPVADGSAEEWDLTSGIEGFVQSTAGLDSIYMKVQERLMYRNTSSADTELELLLASTDGYFHRAIREDVHRSVLPLFEQATEAVGVLEATCELLDDLLRVRVPETMRTITGIQDSILPVQEAVNSFRTCGAADESENAPGPSRTSIRWSLGTSASRGGADYPDPVVEDESSGTGAGVDVSRARFLKVQETMDELMNTNILFGIEQLQGLCSGSIDSMLSKMAKPRLERALDGLMIENGAEYGESRSDWWQAAGAADEFSDDAPPTSGEEFFDDVTDYDSDEDPNSSVYGSSPRSQRGGSSPVGSHDHFIQMDSPECQPACPNSHVLRRALCDGGYVCDVCQRSLDRNEPILHCQECNWGTCGQCIQAAGIGWNDAPPMYEGAPPSSDGYRSAAGTTGARRRGRTGAGAQKLRRRSRSPPEGPSPRGIVVGLQGLQSRPATADDLIGVDESPAQDVGMLARAGLRLGFMQKASPRQE
ncbi:unnamed protein product, partial [Prorocentrum cordatum]